MVAPYWFRTENVLIAVSPGTTFTHALGVAPTGRSGAVYITPRTGTAVVFVSASDSQIVVLISNVVNAAVDLTVEQRHTIVGGTSIFGS